MTPQAPLDEYGPSVTLGGYPITLLEHVGGMATLADMGVLSHARGNPLGQGFVGQCPLPEPTGPARAAGDRPRGCFHPGPGHVRRQQSGNDLRLQQPASFQRPHRRRQNRDLRQLQRCSDGRLHARPGGGVLGGGDILDIHHSMVYGSDGVFVATPPWHAFMEAAHWPGTPRTGTRRRRTW